MRKPSEKDLSGQSSGVGAGVSLGLLLVLTALAAYRLTRLVTTDDVPFGQFRFRLLSRWSGTLAADGLTCAWCVGSVISWALVAGVAQVRSIPLPAIAALAVSCVVGFLGNHDAT